MKKLEPNEASYIVIVTRGHRDDMRILRWAVQTRARYMGMIGSKRKVIEIFKTLQQEGLPAHLFDRVHAPVGWTLARSLRKKSRWRSPPN